MARLRIKIGQFIVKFASNYEEAVFLLMRYRIYMGPMRGGPLNEITRPVNISSNGTLRALPSTTLRNHIMGFPDGTSGLVRQNSDISQQQFSTSR